MFQIAKMQVLVFFGLIFVVFWLRPLTPPLYSQEKPLQKRFYNFEATSDCEFEVALMCFIYSVLSKPGNFTVMKLLVSLYDHLA